MNNEQRAEIYYEAARLCDQRTSGLGFAPYHLGCVRDPSCQPFEPEYTAFCEAFGAITSGGQIDASAALFGDDSVIAFCFAAAMVETGDL